MQNNMSEIRKQLNITQEELAKITDISLTQIRNIEKNRNTPNLSTAIKIMKALHVENIEDLFKD